MEKIRWNIRCSNITERVWAETVSCAPSTHCLPVHTGCQVRIFAQKICHSKNHHLRKSAECFLCAQFVLCEPKVNIHSTARLWKTPVEKPVENVENYELSTGISLFSKFPQTCGKSVYRFA